jgi:hypothetical protein
MSFKDASHRWKLLVVSLAILIIVTGRTSAQEAALGLAEVGAEDLNPAIVLGLLLGKFAAEYGAGKALDQIVDARIATANETELTSIQLNLQHLYKKAIADHANRAKANDANRAKADEINVTLARVTSELNILQEWRHKAPTREQLDRYRKELAADVASLKGTLARHEKILKQHGRQIQQLEETLREQGGEITELKKRLDQEETPPPGPPCSLTLIVEGESDVIRLHTARWCEFSDSRIATGTVRVTGKEVVVDYCVTPGTSALVELAAPSVWVSMPESLSELVEIQDHGFTFHRAVHPDP